LKLKERNFFSGKAVQNPGCPGNNNGNLEKGKGSAQWRISNLHIANNRFGTKGLPNSLFFEYEQEFRGY
jgi:hypothetical protein